MSRAGVQIAIVVVFAGVACRTAPLPPSPHEGLHSVTLSRSYVPLGDARVGGDAASCSPRCDSPDEGMQTQGDGPALGAWTYDIGFGLGMLWRRRVRTSLGFEMGTGATSDARGSPKQGLMTVTPHVAFGVRTYHGGYKLDTDIYLGPRILVLEHYEQGSISGVSMSARPRLSLSKRMGRYTFGLYAEVDALLPGPNVSFGVRLDGEPPFRSAY